MTSTFNNNQVRTEWGEGEYDGKAGELPYFRTFIQKKSISDESFSKHNMLHSELLEGVNIRDSIPSQETG